MGDIADADVIRAVKRDAVPSQRAIGGGEFVAARAGVRGLWLHPNVHRGVLARRQADSHARFIGESGFCRANIEAPRRQAGRPKVSRAVRRDHARFTCIEVLDGHRDIGKACAGLVRHHAGEACTRLRPQRERPHRQPQKQQKDLGQRQ